MNRLAGWLVERRVTGPDDAAEEICPAETRDLSSQQIAGLIADDPEIDPLPRQIAQHRLAPRQRRQSLQVDRAKPLEIDIARFLPALAKMQRECFAQAESHLLARVGERPFR